MKTFLEDMLLGGYLIFSSIIFIAGILILRYRRERGPGLLIAASILGIFSSMIWVFIRSGIVECPEIAPLLIMILSFVLLFFSVIFWRGRN